MKHSQEEILKALHVIKETCVEGPCTMRCPFSNSERGCLITHGTPNGWEINDAPPTQWKGLL